MDFRRRLKVHEKLGVAENRYSQNIAENRYGQNIRIVGYVHEK